ncbi:hypothetical protein QBC38DRAFT_550042 [Podospora fimiseda]|uniref:Ecp2 effector protein domain-containing protein n=1 Tax=Podospora fimiseda TaxID=252190 RepID=A0AAN6YNR4_9PEZI|nr:hypothetical protein QBC38DRAFT_550042 [Podospora fimiseda]
MKLSQILFTIATGLVALVKADGISTDGISGNRDCASANVHFALKDTTGRSPYVSDCKAVADGNTEDIPVGKDMVLRSYGSCTYQFALWEGTSMTINHGQLEGLFNLVKDNTAITFANGYRMESHGTITCGTATVNFRIFQPS